MSEKSPFKFTPELQAGLAVVSGVSSIFGGKRQRKQAARAAREALELRKEQQAKLDVEMEKYRNITFTNPYEGLENTAEDLRVTTQAADFQAQQGAQQRADILGQLRGAAGGSGIAALAQTLANQGALQAQKISADLAKQEVANERQAAKQAQQLQLIEAKGDAQVQQAESGQQATLLGMQFGAMEGANTAYQQAIKNQMAANQYANQMQMEGLETLFGVDYDVFKKPNNNPTGGNPTGDGPS